VFFITPIAHEQSTGRRFPVISAALVVLNLAVFVGMLVYKRPEARATDAIGRAQTYMMKHSYVAVDCHALAPLGHKPGPVPPGVDDDERREAQATMSALCAEADKALYALPTHRFGDVPARGGFLTLLSHQFLHGGWLHILFNMWFLWLAACNLEDRWGRPLFLGFYLVSGVAGALLHRAFNAGSAIPLVGASGAIAGAMGAFLVVLTTTRIRFLYLLLLFLRPKVGTFEAPAYVMLPLWFGLEVLSGFMSPGSGTAHWAHVGGFACGAAIAAGLRLSGLDQKLDAAVDEKASVRGDPRVAEAVQWLDSGRKAEGLQRLAAIAAAEPRNIDARLELLRVATVDNDPELRARSLVDLALCYLDQGLVEAAAGVLTELHQLSLLDRSPPDRLLRLGERFAQKGDALRSGQTLIALYRSGIRDEIGARAAVAHAAVLLKANLVGEASRVLDMVRGSPVAPADLHAKIESLSAQIAGRRVSG
jgi:membrane associated rhomboid family serine protease